MRALAFISAVCVTAAAGAEPPLPLTPPDAAKTFTTPDDLVWELVLAEPEITQPVFCNFDERGRLWVVEYRQYPHPAGLKPISTDDFRRTVYDQVPPAPPHHFKGADRISIHEDTDGDGTFEKHSVFLDGLSICTAIEHGRGGHYVLNPPYLLFYADADGDDVPDGDPQVLLAGFGIEDTHSVANSLRWGPDGWLYGAHGSTVTSRFTRPGEAQPLAQMTGQGIWRYHPETQRCEVFAEGGGNTFGVEFDSHGRLFSGHNGGDTRGFHYIQGAYLRKGFEKHGPLSNPYAFGFFEPMKHAKVERFTHNFVIYEGAALPEKYAGKLFGIEPLQGRIVLSERERDASTFGTKDLAHVLTTTDRWFRPVDIKTGPDGAIYVCDFYEREISHLASYEDATDRANGRIWRLRAKDAAFRRMPNLREQSSTDLLAELASENKTIRQTALRVLLDRRDLPRQTIIDKTVREPSFPKDWHWLLLHHLDPLTVTEVEQICLNFPDPSVREWAIRMLCDNGKLAPQLVQQLVVSAPAEPDLEVRLQLAASARRLPVADCLTIVGELLQRDEDAADPRQPLMLWWAIEAKCADHRDEVVRLFETSPLWERAIVREHLLERVMRRFAAAGTRADLLACARLLELSPTVEHSRKLMSGFEAAFKGRALAGLPDELVRAMERHNVGSSALAVRRGDAAAIEAALKTLADPAAPATLKREFIDVLGEVKTAGAVQPLLKIAADEADDSLRQSALKALQLYDEPGIADRLIPVISRFSPASRIAAETLLASRLNWALPLLHAVKIEAIPPETISLETIAKLRQHEHADLQLLLADLWPESTPAADAVQQAITRYADLLRTGTGDPYAGETLYRASCAACHKLFGEGGEIGPDLTSFQRDDLQALLANTVAPSAEIREGYENHVLTTRDGRVLTGFLADQDERAVVLRGLDGQNTTIPRAEISQLKGAGVSLMPEGLLNAFSEQQVRDLFAYLRSTQPLPPRRKR